MSKSKETSASQAILDYMVKQNRPYSAIDIFNNLHKEYGKTAVVRCLEEMAQKGTIKEKVYGKQKVYVADQTQYAEVNETEMKQMDSNITELTEKLQATTKENQSLDSELRRLSSSITTEEAKKRVAATTQECETLQQKLKSIKANANAVSPEERQTIMKDRTKYVKEWRKRKRIGNDILNAILEGYPKTKKQLCEDVGLETDEEYNVKPPEL